MDLFKNFPSPEKMREAAVHQEMHVRNVNGHFHTPYSFSAFSEVEDVFRIAEDENVEVLGINDFYTMDGYEEFAELCLEYKKFPLFNIEFMGLLMNEQRKNVRVNDPNNPGRTYFSGKGLDCPVSLGGTLRDKLQTVRKESDAQTREMVKKASNHLTSVDPELEITYETILNKYTKGMVRERHIAKAIRSLVFYKYPSVNDRLDALTKIYGGKKPEVNIEDAVAVDGEIRSMLLKTGGVAFVKEDQKAFLEISEIVEIILGAGGIPCYPVLLDNKKEEFTDFERDYEALYNRLTEMNIYSVELIPGRNTHKFLSPFVKFFNDKGFVIIFGTEHNTPALDPLTVNASDGPLGEYLEQVNYEGACIIAAHQYLRAKGENGYLNNDGKPVPERNDFVRLGNAVINQFTK
ncbi:MAG TPA: hypothetical protein VJ951_02055 [Bacteroidales bacterium]|nr:hypothetical protein [Bacteroidales bacterium]